MRRRVYERMDEHDPLMGVCTERKRQRGMGGEQREVNGNNRQFFSLSLSFILLRFVCMYVCVLCSLTHPSTRIHIHTHTLSLLAQTTIEIDNDHPPSRHLNSYIKDFLLVRIKPKICVIHPKTNTLRMYRQRQQIQVNCE